MYTTQLYINRHTKVLTFVCLLIYSCNRPVDYIDWSGTLDVSFPVKWRETVVFSEARLPSGELPGYEHKHPIV